MSGEMIPVLLVDDVNDYLPRPIPDGEPRPPTAYALAPVCVWVPCTELPTVEDDWVEPHSHSSDADADTCAICFGPRGRRRVAPGDVVHLAQPCPRCSTNDGEGLDVGEMVTLGPDGYPMEAPCMDCAPDAGLFDPPGPGVVPGASAVVAKVYEVKPELDDDEDGIIAHEFPDRESGQTWVRDGSATLHILSDHWDLPGDWSNARWGVRVSEVTPL